jgi:hypothetical protein
MLSLTNNSVSDSNCIDVKHSHNFSHVFHLASVNRDKILISHVFGTHDFYYRCLSPQNIVDEKYLLYVLPLLAIDTHPQTILKLKLKLKLKHKLNQCITSLKMYFSNMFYSLNTAWFYCYLCCFTSSFSSKINRVFYLLEQFFLPLNIAYRHVFVSQANSPYQIIFNGRTANEY